MVTIDVNGAGYGWFTDTSALPSGQRADLLTTVLHEMGHEQGLGDISDPDFTGLMAARLPLDTRRLPYAQPGPVRAADRFFAEDLAEIAQALHGNWSSDDVDLLPLGAKPALICD